MTAKNRDRLGSVLLFAFVATLWAQRDYITKFGGLFPDIVMEIMTGLLALALVLSFTRHAAIKEPEGATAKAKGESFNWVPMVVVSAILLAWTVFLQTLGFALSGVLGFAGICWYLGGCPWDWKEITKAVASALAVTYLLIFLFEYLLEVPLPAGTIFG